jgi:DNA-directed RNA polymerase subunit RPC12/RpoP
MKTKKGNESCLLKVMKAKDKITFGYLYCGNCNRIFGWIDERPPAFCPECGRKFMKVEKIK